MAEAGATPQPNGDPAKPQGFVGIRTSNEMERRRLTLQAA